MKIFDLDERLIQFAANIIAIAEKLPQTVAGSHLGFQLIKSGSSPSLNYGEAHASESRKDFIHKMKIGLKELRETFNCLKIILKLGWVEDQKLQSILDENNQLIAIFVKSVKTATENLNLTKKST